MRIAIVYITSIDTPEQTTSYETKRKKAMLEHRALPFCKKMFGGEYLASQ
jgi:hypothetical protein